MDDTTGTGLAAEGICLAFGGVEVLSEVDLRVGPRHILGLIGPNGAGKTTLVNVLTGFQPPDRGRVTIDGADVTRARPQDRVRRGLARTFQGARVFVDMTVAENVEVAALRGGYGRRAARAEAQRLLERAGLTPVADALAKNLTFGDERRLGLVRARAMGPRYLILDEPAAGLNEEESDEMATLIAELRDDGCGIVLIEHDMRLVMSLCDTIQVLDYGKTIARGVPSEVRNDPKVIEAYLGSVA